MNDHLKVFLPYSEEHDKLTIAAICMTHLNKNKNMKYRVEDTYFDYGQNWMYTTIIAHNLSEKPDSVLRTHQALSPREQKEILGANIKDIPKLCEGFIK